MIAEMSHRPEGQRMAAPAATLPLGLFDDFYRAEYPRVVGLAFVLTGNDSVAQDLAQQAFVEAHRKWSTVSAYDSPEAWVRRVLVNKSRSRFRKIASEIKALSQLSQRRRLHLDPTERSMEIWEAVQALPTRQGQVIALKYWDDLTIEQIASILGCSTETVKTHLKRGRATLANQLSGLEDRP